MDRLDDSSREITRAAERRDPGNVFDISESAVKDLAWPLGLKPADRDMPPARYNPFEKPLAQIDVADLATLRAVPEGWYIEYKRELPNVRSIAKSISSLANTYGGWVFYGIEENEADRTPGAFPGISAGDVPAAQMAIRQAVSSSINPPPYFEARSLAGPRPELGLAEERSIIVVEVPLSYAANLSTCSR